MGGFTIPDNDLAAFPLQSQIFETDVATLAAAHAGYGVVSGCAVTAQGTPDMTVAVAAGTIRPGDGTLVPVAGGNVTIDAADATNFRIDLISASATGVKTHTIGTAAALTAVKPPALPAGHTALAFVTVPPAATEIDADQIIDKRLNPGSSGLGSSVFIASQNGCALDSDLTSGGGTDDTAALQALLDVASAGGRVEVILDGPALVTGLDVYSNTVIRCLEGAGLYLASGSDRAIVRNANRSRTTVIDHDIAVLGGVFNGNGPNQGTDPDNTNVDGLQFFGITHLTIRGSDVRNTKSFGTHVANWTYLTIDDYTYDYVTAITQQDGIHLNGPGQYGHVGNVKLRSYDDAIAVNAGDDSAVDLTITNPHGPYVGQGLISDLVIDGVELRATCWSGIRLLSHDANSRIDRVRISNVTGTVLNAGMYIGSFGDTGDASIGNVVVDGWSVTNNGAGGGHPDPMFRIENSFESLTFRNVKVHKPDNARPIFWFYPSVEGDSVEIEGLSIYEDSASAAGLIPVQMDGHVKRVRGFNWNWVRFSPAVQQTVPFVSLANAASQIVALILDGVQANGVNHLVDHTAGSLSDIHAVNIRHETDGGNATFRTTGTIGGIVLSNWVGSDPIDGTFTVQGGDAFTGGSASDVTYDNATSGLAATDVQAAIDELDSNVDGLASPAAADVTYDNATSGLASSDVQAAVDELDAAIDALLVGSGNVTVTTKGDLQGYSTAPARVPVGPDGTTLVADSTQALGVRYAKPAPAQIVSNTTTGGTVACTLVSPASTSLFFVCFAGVAALCTISSIAQTNVTWTKLHSTSNANAGVELWKGVPTGTPGTTVTATLSGSTNGMMTVSEWPAGHGLAGTLDQSSDANNQTGTTGQTTQLSGQIVPTAANALAFVLFGDNNGTVHMSPPAGPFFTLGYGAYAVFGYCWCGKNPVASGIFVQASGAGWSNTICSVI